MRVRIIISFCKMLGLTAAIIIALFIVPLETYAKDIIVVLDPGHGGDSLGGHNETFQEKYLDFETAIHIKNRLEQYDGVKVFLTREGPDEENTSLKDRAALAEELNADYLFSIHYNMSENHNLFGCEVWTSAFGDYYVQGQQFGDILVHDLIDNCGFFNRGVKTRLGEKEPDKDYYTIIHESLARGIVAVIIEHCHMDEERDTGFLLNESEPYKKLGIIDADAIAKFLKLSSASLGIDNSSYRLKNIAYPSAPVGSDLTPPEYAQVELIAIDTDKSTAHIKISSADNSGYIQYYCYSTDGGVTFSKLWPWSLNKEALEAENVQSIETDIPIDMTTDTTIVVKTYNQYERTASSNSVVIEKTVTESEVEINQPKDSASEEEYEEFVEIKGEITEDSNRFGEAFIDHLSTKQVIIIAIAVFLAVSILGLTLVLVWRIGRRNEHRH